MRTAHETRQPIGRWPSTLSVVCLLLLFGSPASAHRLTNRFDNVVMLNGERFTNVRFKYIVGDEVGFTHSRGATTLPWTAFPDEILAQLGVRTREERAEARRLRDAELARQAAERARQETEREKQWAKTREQVSHSVSRIRRWKTMEHTRSHALRSRPLQATSIRTRESIQQTLGTPISEVWEMLSTSLVSNGLVGRARLILGGNSPALMGLLLEVGDEAAFIAVGDPISFSEAASAQYMGRRARQPTGPFQEQLGIMVSQVIVRSEGTGWTILEFRVAMWLEWKPLLASEREISPICEMQYHYVRTGREAKGTVKGISVLGRAISKEDADSIEAPALLRIY